MNIMNEPNGKEASATRSAYKALREKILTGALPAGEKLKIEELRKMLDTGSSPVREALSLLTSDMLVERLDHRGFRTASANLENFQEILGLRCALEVMALRLSIAHADREWEEALVLSHYRMNRLQKAGSTAEFENAHKEFHMALLARANSPILLRYCDQLYDLNIRYRFLAAGQTSYEKRDIAAEHEKIFEAAVAGDADAAAEALTSHYQVTGDYLNQHLSKL